MAPSSCGIGLDVTSDRIVLDTSASDDQVPGPVNFLMSPPVPAMVFGSYLLGEGSEAILNAGVETAIDEVIVRPGSILQPKLPAPLGMRGVTMMRNMATCLGLLNVATGGRAMAAHSAYVIWYLRGRDDNGELFLLSDGLGVGYGARPTADGNDAVYLVAQENFPSEFLDSVFPVRVAALRHQPRHRRAGALARRLRPRSASSRCWRRRPWCPCASTASSIRPGASPAAMRRERGAASSIPGRPDERLLRPLSDGNMVQARRHRARRDRRRRRLGPSLRPRAGAGGGRRARRVRQPGKRGGALRRGDGRRRGYPSTWRPRQKRRAQRPEAKLFHRHGYHDVLA